MKIGFYLDENRLLFIMLLFRWGDSDTAFSSWNVFAACCTTFLYLAECFSKRQIFFQIAIRPGCTFLKMNHFQKLTCIFFNRIKYL